jgi:GT2 family glycosyltransferase
MVPDRPKVTVAIVTYNSGRVLADCLRSLPAGFGEVGYEVVVADNASADDTVAVAHELAPNVRVAVLKRNRGYAAGVNAAIAEARATEAVYVLNPDARLYPGSVRPLIDALDDRATGIAVPKLLNDDGELQFSLRREPTVTRAFGEAVIGGRRAARTKRFGEIIGVPGAYEHPTTCDWASGAAMLVARRCLDAVGPWDESFFLYSEETDFALRARDAGFVLRYVPDAVVKHLGGEMSRDPRLWSMAPVNRVRLYRRRHGRVRSGAFTTAVVINEALRAATGSPTHRAGLRALLQPSSRPAEVA